ncbi:MAG TPA: sensor histidine kinase [Tissierellia bacterium]|nr:sensor histidine kinase [Tissierellia bacterium]
MRKSLGALQARYCLYHRFRSRRGKPNLWTDRWRLLQELKEEIEQREIYQTKLIRYIDHYEELQRFLHDIKNHLAVNQVLKRYHDWPELSWVQTLDILIEAKRCQARAEGVDFEFERDDLVEAYLSDRDIIRLFGNLFDNAISAAAKGPPGTVSGRVSCIKGAMIVLLENSSPSTRLIEGFPTRQNHPSSGKGIVIIRSVVSKHQGSIEYHQANGKISLEIVLYPSIIRDSKGDDI